MKVYGQYSIKNCVSERAMCYKKSLYVLFSTSVSHCFWRKYCIYWYELKFELYFLLPGNNATIIKMNLEKETSSMKGESYTYLWT